MPGTRGQEERTVLVQVRITKTEAAAWRGHVKEREGYISSMVRACVNEHIAETQGLRICKHWE